MTLHVIDATRIEPTPWRNGGGTARTLLTWPSADTLRVHVALAHIGRDVAFSGYPGMQRWFMSLNAQPVLLKHRQHQVSLNVDSPPYEFDGGDPPFCELLQGPIDDVSFMVPAAHGVAHALRSEEGAEFAQAGTWRGAFSVQAATLWVDGLQVAALPAHSLAWSADAHPGRWQLHSAGLPLQAWWLHYREHFGEQVGT